MHAVLLSQYRPFYVLQKTVFIQSGESNWRRVLTGEIQVGFAEGIVAYRQWPCK
jgi:hypothetical protein